MRAESLQKPVANYEITFIDRDYVEVEFFNNIVEKQKQDEDNTVTVYEFDHYRIKIRNRSNLIDQLNQNYEQWLQYAISQDPNTEPTELEIAMAQYAEYDELDIPTVIEEMRLQDPSLAEEFINMRIELRKFIYNSDSAVTTYSVNVQEESDELKKFKSNYLKFKNKLNKK